MFDEARRQNNKIRFADSYYEWQLDLCKDLIDRVTPLGKTYKNILQIGGVEQDSQEILAHFGNSDLVFTEANSLRECDAAFDLIICPFELHWINDIPAFLSRVSSLLVDEGVFVANFLGVPSLQKLKELFIELESRHCNLHSPHIPPFVGAEKFTNILDACGLHEAIVDTDKIELEYTSPLKLIKTIKHSGNSSPLTQFNPFGISKAMYKELQDNRQTFRDCVKIVTLIAAKKRGVVVGRS